MSRLFGGVLYLDSSELPSKPGKKVSRIDWILAIAFLLFAFIYFLAKLQNNFPDVILGSDAANIASFAAAWDHPDLFKNDALLFDLNNIQIYATIHIPFLRLLNSLVGNYGLAMAWMLVPNIFLLLLGYYVLGRTLLKSRYWALLFTIVNSMPLTLNLSEAWGIIPDPVPRLTFQALLPFLLALIWVWRDQPRRWPWIMVFAGALVYVHPVSTPTWLIAIWLGLWLLLPKEWPFKKRLRVMLGLGILSLLVALPFILNYLAHHVQGKSANYDLVYYVINSFFPINILNVPSALADFIKATFGLGIFPLSLIGLVIVWILRRADRRQIYLILIWIVGLILMAVVVPGIEYPIERYLHMIPVETELIRGMRYLVLFMILFSIWPLSEISRRLKSHRAGLGVSAAGALLVIIWIALHPPMPDKMLQAVTCFSQGKAICAAPSDSGLAMEAIKVHIPAGASIFSASSQTSKDNFGLTIRYLALHPLAYSYKDRGLLVYSNDEALRQWNEIYGQMYLLRYESDPQKKLNILYGLSKRLGVNYLLLNFKIDPILWETRSAQLIYNNDTYTLLYLEK